MDITFPIYAQDVLDAAFDNPVPFIVTAAAAVSLSVLGGVFRIASRPTNRITIWSTSPSDYNDVLKLRDSRLFGREPMTTTRKIVRIVPANLPQLERQLMEIRTKGQKIDTIVFCCHSIPIAIKPTENIIKIPDNPAFDSDNFFLNESAAKRVPDSIEYEDFDRFVSIINKNVRCGGTVYLLGCSTAVDTKHPEKNITYALAKRVKSINVIGTTFDIGSDDFSLVRGKRLVRGPGLRVVRP